MRQKLGYYPGCSLEGTAKEYNESVEAIAKLFDVELVPVPDWNCCGASAAHNVNKKLSLSLPARILANAVAAGMNEIVVPCAACYSKLIVIQHELFQNKELKSEIEQIVGIEISRQVKILNVLEFIQEYILPTLAEKADRSFAGKKVASYYGCLLVRPHKITKFDRLEDPQSMDRVMEALGAEIVEWPFKTECCGAGLSISRTDLVGKLSGRIIAEAVDRGADAIVVACPMCHSNLDLRRGATNKYLGVKNDMPVLYVTQAIGLACGLDDKELGIRRHMVKVDWQAMTIDKVKLAELEAKRLEEEQAAAAVKKAAMIAKAKADMAAKKAEAAEG